MLGSYIQASSSIEGRVRVKKLRVCCALGPPSSVSLLILVSHLESHPVAFCIFLLFCTGI